MGGQQQMLTQPWTDHDVTQKVYWVFVLPAQSAPIRHFASVVHQSSKISHLQIHLALNSFCPA